MYDEKAKARMMKYMHIKRESLQLNLPLGTKDLWKDYAADMGMSVTQLITKLIEKDMKEHNWTETLNPYNMASKPKETDDWQKWGFKPQKYLDPHFVLYHRTMILNRYSSIKWNG